MNRSIFVFSRNILPQLLAKEEASGEKHLNGV
jgi:hypothetical protein